jgi:hypothetical protein
VRRWHDFDKSAGEIEAAVVAALYHALEELAHLIGAEMAHGDVQPAVRSELPFAHFLIHAP